MPHTSSLVRVPRTSPLSRRLPWRCVCVGGGGLINESVGFGAALLTGSAHRHVRRDTRDCESAPAGRPARHTRNTAGLFSPFPSQRLAGLFSPFPSQRLGFSRPWT